MQCPCGSARSTNSPDASNVTPARRQRTLFRRAGDVCRWTAPGVVLLILPKCPACLAGYIAVGTGVGLSITSATYVRWLLIALCVISLVLMVWRAIRRIARAAATRVA